jgi:hypothetical protein
MGSTLSASQLQDLREKAKLWLRLDGDTVSFRSDAIAIYHDESASATAATVQVESNTLTLVITGGANAGTDTFDLTNASYDTLTELVAGITALAKGWVATLLTDGDSTSTDLFRFTSTSAFGQTNEVTLEIVDNELLDLLITNTLASLETALGDVCLLSSSFSELHDWDQTITLRNNFVTRVNVVFGDCKDGLTAKYTGSDTNARLEVTDTAVVLTSVAGGTTTTNTIAFTDQVTTTLMAAAITAVSGWTGTLLNDGPSQYLGQRGSYDAKDREVTLELWAPFEGDHRVWYDSGVLELRPWGYGYMFSDGAGIHSAGGFHQLASRVRVDYTAGFDSLPADVELALLNAIKTVYDETNRTAGLTSESLGDYSYTVSQSTETVNGSGGLLASSTQAAAKSLWGKYGRMIP